MLRNTQPSHPIKTKDSLAGAIALMDSGEKMEREAPEIAHSVGIKIQKFLLETFVFGR